MNLRRIAGAAMLLSVVAAIFGSIYAVYGLSDALIVLAVSLTGVVLAVAGCHLLFD